MRLAFFDCHAFEKGVFETENATIPSPHQISFFEAQLNQRTAPLAMGYEAVCCFVNDRLDSRVLEILAPAGLKLIALRCAGFNNVDLESCRRHGIAVARVPAYSPYAVAEHALGLILALNRKIHRSYARVREFNFSLEGLVGFDLHGKTIGIVGTGKIGEALTSIAFGLGMQILAFDPIVREDLPRQFGLKYVPLDQLFKDSDIISLHMPLTEKTRYMINASALSVMKPDVILISTGRGALIDTRALVHALKKKQIGGAGLDVYEEEEKVFFRDLSSQGIDDDVLARLLSFSNVVVTAHQGFLTREALQNITRVTLANITAFEKAGPMENEVRA